MLLKGIIEVIQWTLTVNINKSTELILHFIGFLSPLFLTLPSLNLNQQTSFKNRNYFLKVFLPGYNQ